MTPSFEFPLDFSLSSALELPNPSPSILLLPSKFQTFVKECVGGTLCVNPGRLCLGEAGGCYAKLTVHPLGFEKDRDGDEKMKDQDEDDSRKHSAGIARRTRVEIIRI